MANESYQDKFPHKEEIYNQNCFDSSIILNKENNEPLNNETINFIINSDENNNNVQNLIYQKTSSKTNEIQFSQKPNINNFNIELNLKFNYVKDDNFSTPIPKFDPKNNKVYKEVDRIEIKREEKKNLFITKKTSNCGRKTFEDAKIGKRGLHNKYSSDNIIRKIKSNFGKNFYYFLVNHSKLKDLLKLNSKVNESLKADYNIDLFNKKFKDIIRGEKISIKYKHKNKNENEKLINEICKENEELEKILDLTYLEVFEIFRRNLKPEKKISSTLMKKIEGTNILDTKYFKDAEKFIEEIRAKQKNEEKEDIDKYIEDIKGLILNFEDWFKNKKPRIRKTINNSHKACND